MRGMPGRCRVALSRRTVCLALIAMLLGLASLLQPSVTLAAALQVTTTLDTIDAGNCGSVRAGDLPGPDGVVSLRESICAANNTPGDDQIAFDLGGPAPWTILLNGSELPIASNLTITGPGAALLTIDAAQQSRAVRISGGAFVTLSGVTITGGRLERDSGAGILSQGVLVVDACVITGNWSGGTGGGINSYALPGSPARLVLIDSIVRANRGAFTSGGVASIAHGSATSASLVILGSTIDSNYVFEGAGGGVFAIASFGGQSSVDILNSTISNNVADNSGGGIVVDGASGDPSYLTITNSTISRNRARNGGGGLYMTGGSARLRFATIAMNHANAYNDGSYGGGGGGIDNYTGGAPSVITVQGSIIAGNMNGTGVAARPYDCYGPLRSEGYNVLAGDCSGTPPPLPTGDAPFLGDLALLLNPALADNGGPTFTHALPDTSSAVDRVTGAICQSIPAALIDQRGVARPAGASCDSGAVEAPAPATETSLDSTVPLTFTSAGEGEGTIIPLASGALANGQGGGYPVGTPLVLLARPAPGSVFVGWSIDGVARGWANPATLTADGRHAITAIFQPVVRFSDMRELQNGQPVASTVAARELAARGIVRGFAPDACAERGLVAPCFGPTDRVLRAQLALLITRAFAWDSTAPSASLFTDLDGLDPALQRAVGILADREVVVGYGDGRFGPHDPALSLQEILVISRAMVVGGYWTTIHDGDPRAYQDIILNESERLDFITFLHYSGQPPGFNAFLPSPPPFYQPAPRDWGAQLLWQALDRTFGVDQRGLPGEIP